MLRVLCLLKPSASNCSGHYAFWTLMQNNFAGCKLLFAIFCKHIFFFYKEYILFLQTYFKILYIYKKYTATRDPAEYSDLRNSRRFPVCRQGGSPNGFPWEKEHWETPITWFCTHISSNIFETCFYILCFNNISNCILFLYFYDFLILCLLLYFVILF